MLQITPHHNLFMAIEPIDFRNGIDGIKAICQRQWSVDPFHGHVFIFRNRAGTAIKLLSYDGNGFWLCQKRYSSGKLKWWPRSMREASSVRAVELLVMLQQGNPAAAHVPEDWRRLPVTPSYPDNSTAANVRV
jgi:transposase